MKSNKFIYIINFFIVILCTQNSFAQSPGSQDGATLNALEQALDFQTGTKAQYRDWMDDGHLNKLSFWHGIDLMGVEIQRGSDGLLQFAALVPFQTSSVKEIKIALGKACGIKADDWDREDLQGRTTLKAQGTKCRADFNNWFRGNGVWGISIYKNK
jgi:hypothetical protein